MKQPQACLAAESWQQRSQQHPQPNQHWLPPPPGGEGGVGIGGEAPAEAIEAGGEGRQWIGIGLAAERLLQQGLRQGDGHGRADGGGWEEGVRASAPLQGQEGVAHLAAAVGGGGTGLAAIDADPAAVQQQAEQLGKGAEQELVALLQSSEAVCTAGDAGFHGGIEPEPPLTCPKLVVKV